MKNWLTQILGLCTAIILLSSCEKDEERIVAKSGRETTLSTVTTNVPLTLDDANKTYVVYSWTPVSFGFMGEVVSYTLEIDKKGNEFASPKSFATGSALSKTFTVSEINNLMIDLGAVQNPDTKEYSPIELEVRAKAALGGSPTANALAKYSPTTALAGKPYNANAAIVYPSLWVPGAYQGWAPDKAPVIASGSKTNTTSFEGYINFAEASKLEFKLTDNPTWDKGIFGKGTSTTTNGVTTGTLASPGDNITLPEPGYYQVKANLTANTFTLTKTTWAVIGSGTAKGWDNDTPMTYDAATGVWTITTALSADGEIKFRANNAWDLNYGDKVVDGKADGLLDAGSDNIKVPEPGNYTITLDLSKGAGNYGYTLKKN
ncbi:SusE domain-containing protein [Hymenobacter sp. BT188]|uniref:SusE domain-containing protein n=1 Tax=Hymenobacter sp. BT188 TaxID=2763504 RepID=UPI0016519E76|nr:SusE domain-containing protein [Hymenobacter sp. BT188]MBC6607677.1 SusE domain-containing protein [Hymenobacter sp. BT188]